MSPRHADKFTQSAQTSCLACVPNNAGHDASRRTAAATLHLGTVLPGPDGAHSSALIPQAFARVHPDRVQPLKAAPRSWSGRLPEASRARGYESRAQAPHQPTSGLPDFGPLKLPRHHNVS